MALGVGKGPYTPPASVMKLRKEKALLPALYAANGDFILLRDEISLKNLSNLFGHDLVVEKNLNIITLNDLSELNEKISRIVPWGWDHAIVRDLMENGVKADLMPSPDELDNLRNLSHRRTAIFFREKIGELLHTELLNLPKELFSLEEVKDFLYKNPLAYFKAPWSSSGRGIVVSDHITRKGLLEWCHGVIRQQGSVIAEPKWERTFDFATEWEIRDANVIFMGVSVFETSSRGKYKGNINKPQEELFNFIKTSVPTFSDKIIKAQKKTIETLIAPNYQGYLGIDLLADAAGRINPCVELNLRLTMGHIPILSNNLSGHL